MMRRVCFHAAVALAFVGLASVATAVAQDFEKSYRIGAGGQLAIRNVSGNVNISGYDGDAIMVTGYKEGRDRDLVQVEDLSSGNRVDLRVRYPENCDCEASLRFQVQVPRAVSYNFDQISTASGNIEINSVKGNLRARSASGNVSVKNLAGSVDASVASGNVQVEEVVGSVSAKSASGDVEVTIARLEGADKMTFSSASGNVSVKLPSDLDAEVDLSSLSGSVKTDFPIEVQERERGPGRFARGRLGQGSRSLKVSSVSGNVSLLHN